MNIYITNLSFTYQIRPVLSRLTFSLKQGDYLVIKGKNGAGKSTLIKCFLGINEVNPGSIFYDETDITEFKDWTKFGYVSQNFDSFNYEFPITVSELLSVSSSKKSSPSERLKLLDKMKIFDIQNTNINALSGGQLQRVFIVRAMLNHPDILVLDEPTASIDKQNKQFFYQVVDELNQAGMTIILITHSDDIDHINYTHSLTLNNDTSYVFTAGKDLTEGDES